MPDALFTQIIMFDRVLLCVMYMRMHAFQDDSKAIVSISQTFDAAFHIFVSSFHFACNCNNMSDFAHSKNTYGLLYLLSFIVSVGSVGAGAAIITEIPSSAPSHHILCAK